MIWVMHLYTIRRPITLDDAQHHVMHCTQHIVFSDQLYQQI